MKEVEKNWPANRIRRGPTRTLAEERERAISTGDYCSLNNVYVPNVYARILTIVIQTIVIGLFGFHLATRRAALFVQQSTGSPSNILE